MPPQKKLKKNRIVVLTNRFNHTIHQFQCFHRTLIFALRAEPAEDSHPVEIENHNRLFACGSLFKLIVTIVIGKAQ